MGLDSRWRQNTFRTMLSERRGNLNCTEGEGQTFTQWFFCRKNKMPDSRTISTPAHTLVTILSTVTPSPPHASKSHSKRERHKTQMEHVDVLPERVISPLVRLKRKRAWGSYCYRWLPFHGEVCWQLLKNTTKTSILQCEYWHFIFLKKEKKEYILLVTGNVYKDTFFHEFTH